MNSFLEITSNDNWFKQHPEKIAGEEYETTSFYFPIMVKGTKEDVLRVTGMRDNNPEKPKNITVSVLRYKANGNDLIDRKITIDAIDNIENAFVVNYASLDQIYVVLKLTKDNKTIYFEEGSYSKNALEKINQQIVNQAIERFENNLKDTETVRHVSKLSLEVAEKLGYDYKKLQQLRDAFYKQKSEDELILKQQKEQQKIEAAKTEIENAIKTFTEFAFGNGGIHYDTLEILIKENNLEKPHIRTIGSLRKRNVIFKEQGSSYNYRGTAGYNISTNDPIYNAIEQLKEIYKSNPDKEKRIRLAKAKAKAIKIKLSLGQLGISVVMNAEDIKLTTPFNKQIIKAMKKGYQPTDIFHLGKPFGELEKHIPDYKIVMTGKVLSKAMTKDKDHQLNWANFIDLPFFLNNPTAIFKSETIGYVVLTEVFDVNKKPVMISLHINKKMIITNIASLYVRNYNTYERWIDEKLHLYINEKSDLFNYHRLQLP